MKAHSLYKKGLLFVSGKVDGMYIMALEGGVETALTLTEALTAVGEFVTKGFTFMTQAPMVYFIAFGLLSAGIGIFARAKSAAK